VSILKPSLDELMKKIDSKYALVVAAAKRGRQITEGRERVIEAAVPKAVTQALEEIARGEVGIVKPGTAVLEEDSGQEAVPWPPAESEEPVLAAAAEPEEPKAEPEEPKAEPEEPKAEPEEPKAEPEEPKAEPEPGSPEALR
jgi:DNA-directed RNA polymerase omega subunit